MLRTMKMHFQKDSVIDRQWTELVECRLGLSKTFAYLLWLANKRWPEGVYTHGGRNRGAASDSSNWASPFSVKYHETSSHFHSLASPTQPLIKPSKFT